MASFSCRFILIVTFSCGINLALSELSSDFYGNICPQLLPTIRLVVFSAIAKEPRIGASLLRLHFHDCFVNGCDASVLLDDTLSFTGEKTAAPNNNSLRGFDVIDEIKAAVNLACSGNVVSCADILAVAARDSVVALGGAPYNVQLGRRDATTANFDAANNDLPAPIFDLPSLISNFESHNLTLQDLVALSGAHSLGFARCNTFRSRLYNETSTIDHSFAQFLQAQCPPFSGQGDDILAPLDDSPARFDTEYFDGLRLNRGVLHSDQQLFMGDGGEADLLVRYYSEQRDVFWADFGASMVKMGSLSPLLGSEGEIRENCRCVNLGS